MEDKEFLTVQEAMDYLHIRSRTSIGRIIQDYHLKLYVSPLDRRERLLKKSALDKLKRPQRWGKPLKAPQGGERDGG